MVTKIEDLLNSTQHEAVRNMHNGCILCGDVGSGKTRTSLFYYYKNHSSLPLYVITTAKKRDSGDWEAEACMFSITNITVDSWNNIAKYKDIHNAFFIFDEQRVVGYGAWTKSFLKISKSNPWILLSATPGDNWMDYLPVFIANGYYKNKSDFVNMHVVYSRYTKWPSVSKWLNKKLLEERKKAVLVSMKDMRTTRTHDEYIRCDYDFQKYKYVEKEKKTLDTGEPLKNASQYCQELRKVSYIHESRRNEILKIFKKHERIIIFYNFNYELDILRNIDYGKNVKVAEWNGHHHEEVPKNEKWVYLVQYTAGAEGWNCITTDCVIFYSQTYSWKSLHQAKGRIDRMNTPYRDLYYYHLISDTRIEAAIKATLGRKRDFNAGNFVRIIGGDFDRR